MTKRIYVIVCSQCSLYLHDSDTPSSHEICCSCQAKEEEEIESRRFAIKEGKAELQRIWDQYAEEK